MTLIHLLGIIILPYCGQWQFLTTGIVIAMSLLLLAQLQWDMRLAIDTDYDFLTPEQKQFNQAQQQKRALTL